MIPVFTNVKSVRMETTTTNTRPVKIAPILFKIVLFISAAFFGKVVWF